MIEAKKSDNLIPNRPYRSNGFTLIELLVVIAIIAILAAILMPVLAKAQARAKQAESLSNVKQWAVAQNMYVDDNNQCLPLTKVPNGTPGTPGGYDEDQPNWNDLGDVYHTASTGNAQAAQVINGVWFDALPTYVGGRPLYYYITSINNGISIYNNAHSLFHCPSAVLDPTVNPNIRVIFHYGMNSKGMYGNFGTTTNSPVRMTLVKHPSYFVMFSDNRVSSSDEMPWDTSGATKMGSPQNYTSRLSMRHNKGANIGFSDGHAAWFKYDYAVVNVGGKPSDPGKFDLNWGYDGTSVDGVGAP
jgi:prepilin-type N-terminal cleavage/methylation domain-containing protein/prepilin-type processing-associated H-X9-DG protein